MFYIIIIIFIFINIYINLQVRQFFLAEILTQPNQKATVLAIKRAIQVAQFCFLYNNFSSTIEILSALWNSKCTALDKVWDVSIFF